MNPGNPYGAGPGSPYPRQSGRVPRREIDMAAIGEAWGIITKNWAPFVLAGVLLIIISLAAFVVVMGGTFMAAFNAGRTGVPAARPDFLTNMVMGVGLAVIINVASVLFTGGIAVMALKVLRGQSPEVGDIFAGFQRNPGSLIVVGILVGLMVGIGNQLLWLPGILLGGLSMLSVPFVVDRNLGPIEAIKESFSLTSKNLVMAAVIYFVASLLSGLGFCLCLLPGLLTLPLAYATAAVVYEDLTADPGLQAPY